MAKKTFATCDCETDPFSLEQGTDIKPFIWGLYSGKRYYKFYTTKDFVDFVKHKNWNVYAHNGGKFDYMFLLDFLELETDEEGKTAAQDIKVINGRLSRFSIGRCTFYDSYNILPVPLSALEKDDFDYSKLEKSVRHLHMEEIEIYLENDCKYLYKYVSEFMDRFTAKITLASTAMNQFESLVAPMPESTQEFHDQLKPFYYGGRVSPFKVGVIKPPENGDIEIYDINSAYPTAMMESHPYGTQEGKDWVIMYDLPKRDDLIENCFIELTCKTVSVNGMNSGAFPYRDPKNKNGGIDFPLGKFDFKVTGWEYLAARDTGAIKNVKINKVYWFTDIMSFEDYITPFYDEKKKADAIRKTAPKDSPEYKNATTDRLFAKLMLNSQYGKFCQDSRKFRQYAIVDTELAEDYMIYGTLFGEVANPATMDIAPEHKAEINDWRLTREFANGMCIVESALNKDHTFYNVATGASITGWVRAFMWRSLCKVDTPLYCDTDSIACFGGGSLPLGTELGEWDLELSGVERMAIAGKKLYAAFPKSGKPKTACKGVRLSADEIERVARGEEVLYKKESPVFSLSTPPRMLERFVNRKDVKDENVEKRRKKMKK